MERILLIYEKNQKSETYAGLFFRKRRPSEGFIYLNNFSKNLQEFFEDNVWINV